jgi:energy-coupling factor transporter ATP-binding protein EcfA2
MEKSPDENPKIEATLEIRNFGPIKNLKIKIKRYNILIGPQASGKSTIAKLLCVIHDYYPQALSKHHQDSQNSNVASRTFELDNDDLFKKILKNYRIENFLFVNSIILFEDNFFSFEYSNNKIKIVLPTYYLISVKTARSLGYYIPAERISLPMISESLFELTFEQSSLPQFFLKFGRDFTISRGKHDNDKVLPVFDLGFEFKDNKNYIRLDSGKLLLMEDASSAIQANIPLILILENQSRISAEIINKLIFPIIVIEELELHCFPILQKKLLNYVIEKTNKQPYTYVVLPTHSPYILSAANNLLFANKVGSQSEESRLETNKIINETSWIDRDDFTAYFIDNGTAKSIVNEQTGLIDQNELDGISEDLGEEFDLLMDLYKPAHA